MAAEDQRPKIMDIFVTRPVLAVVLSLVLILMGLQAAKNISVLQYPKMESSSLVITTPYVGASAEVVQGFVTEPIERAASTVPGIDYISSSTSPGLSTITVWLKLNEDSTDALAELSARLAQIRFQLPTGAEDPAVHVERADRSGSLFYLSVDTKHFSRSEVTDYLARHVTPLISAIDGVQTVRILSGRYPAMRVWVDPMKMAAFNISAEELETALRSNNIIATLGESENQQQRFTLLANTTLKTVDEFKNLIIHKADGSLIYLKDIARVELGEEEGQTNGRLDQELVVYLGVDPLPGANEIAIGDDLYEVLEQVNASMPKGMEVIIGHDGTLYMRDAIREIFITLIETIILVGIVVLGLMGSIRTALVPLVTIPISLLGAVAAISIMGFSLNLLTILAIVLSVGLVVDDAIVVVENVSRLMREEGKTRIEAALASSRQLLSPIIGMTITLAAVYAPIGFLSGLTGLLFKEFAFTLSIAVLISGLVAITLSPIMSAYANPEGGKQAPLTRWVNRRFDLLHRSYGKLLDKTLLWQNQILVAALTIALLAVPLYLFSPKELAPVEDQSSIQFIYEAPPNASLEHSTHHMHEVIDKLLTTPDVDYIWQVLQPSAGFGGIRLISPSERDQTSKDKLPQLYMIMKDIAALRVFPVLPASLPTPGRFGVEMVVQSADKAADMKPYADQLVAAAFMSGKFLFANTELKVDMPQVNVVLDKQRIADLGLNLSSVSKQLGVLLSGNYTNRFDMNSRAYHVIPMLEDQNRQNPEALLDLQLRTPSGELVPLSAVAKLQHQVAPRVLNKFQQKNAFTIVGSVLPNTTNEQGLATLEAAAKEILPPGYTIDYSGESRQIRQEGNSLAGILGTALIFVYFVLAILFNSFRDPMVVLLGSVPLALAGAMVFPFLGWTTINIYSQIGFITLIGLIAKNGILIVEFAKHLQQQGLSKLDAIKGAAETRLRPVLMTTAATALGHFPLVLVTGAGAEARNSIGIILVAGMLVGTLFTLFVLPCLYLLIAKSHTQPETTQAEAELA